MKEFDSTTFNEAIASNNLVLVDFWAAWCMPCKVFAPAFEELQAELGDIAAFGKVNIDDHGDLASKYSVTSIPTLVLFKNGQEVERLVGVNPKDIITTMVKKHI